MPPTLAVRLMLVFDVRSEGDPIKAPGPRMPPAVGLSFPLDDSWLELARRLVSCPIQVADTSDAKLHAAADAIVTAAAVRVLRLLPVAGAGAARRPRPGPAAPRRAARPARRTPTAR
jgi:hypothetical protein